MSKQAFRWLEVVAFLLMFTSRVSGDAIYAITLDTAPLIGHPAGPFSLNLEFTDGSGVGDGNNTAVLSNFQFGSGGSAMGIATLFGGTSGSLQTQVVLTDSSFLNFFTQSFAPGDALSFTLDSTTNVDPGSIPDDLSFAILDSSGTELPTTGFFDAFLELDLNSSSPVPITFATQHGLLLLAEGQSKSAHLRLFPLRVPCRSQAR